MHNHHLACPKAQWEIYLLTGKKKGKGIQHILKHSLLKQINLTILKRKVLSFISGNNQCPPRIWAQNLTTTWRAGASDGQSCSAGSSVHCQALPGHRALHPQLYLTFYTSLDISTTEAIGHMFFSYNKNNVWRDEPLRQRSAKHFPVAMMWPHWFQDVALGIKERMEREPRCRPAFEWRQNTVEYKQHYE